MEYWYEQHGDKWEFWYKLDKEEQEKIDSIMPEAIKIFKGESSEVD
jgi:hypothetical protein